MAGKKKQHLPAVLEVRDSNPEGYRVFNPFTGEEIEGVVEADMGQGELLILKQSGEVFIRRVKFEVRAKNGRDLLWTGARSE